MSYFLNEYYDQENDRIIISAAQGSQFAKVVANDFNPIHNVDSRRFCVPGDLLFAIALQRYGLHQTMQFSFQELVKADTSLIYPISQSDQKIVLNHRDKTVLGIELAGRSLDDLGQIEQLIRKYVAFSGHNFPHILVPLMKQHQVMINPQRPLVIYEKMSLHFDELEFKQLNIELTKTNFTVNGKRGDAELHFVINDNDKTIGSGIKSLVLSGLREYEQASIDEMCALYEYYSNQGN